MSEARASFDDKGKVLVPPAVSTPPVDTKLFGISTNNLVDIQQGPDGAIYYIEWGNDVIRRIEYNPTSPATACTDATLFPAALAVSNLRRNNLNMPSMAFRLNHQSSVVDLNAAYQLQILDLNGKIIKTYQGRGEASYDLPMNLGAGIYNVILKSPSGVQSIRVLNRVSSN